MKKIVFLVLSILLFSCDDNKKRILPSSTGKINSMAVVIDTNLWKSAVGDSIRSYFAAPIDAIPSEPEPLFSIHQLPPVVFEGNTRSSRNILIVDVSEKNRFQVRDTLFAKPQKIVHISGQTTDDIIKEIQKNAEKIISIFKENETNEIRNRFNGILAKTDNITKELGINIQIPNTYSLVKNENNFFWYEKRIKGGTVNLILYEVSADFLEKKQKIDEKIVQMRDSIGKFYIPGREEGMYMITEATFPPILDTISVKKTSVIESRGIWEMKNFILAGPFVNYVFLQGKEKYLVVEGFIMAPGFAKRDHLFELEAIAKSVTF